MGEWKKTSCTLCACTCGLEVQVENNRIVRVRGDKSNPKTMGYVCRKGRSIKYFQHQKDRNLYPMKRVGDQFIQISWDQALTEIGERLKAILDEYGPRAFACQGLGGFLGALHTVMAKQFMGCTGSQLHYRALAAELTGFYWSCGSMLGNQTFSLVSDEENSDVMIVSGWNPYVTHQTTRGKMVVKEFATNPDKCLIVIDPRRSETAQMADIHLAIRPGTDALFWKAMIALVLQKGWIDKEYIKMRISDFETILPWFENVDVREYCRTCMLDYEDVCRVARMALERKTGTHSDLGVICGRHSTLATHLQNIFMALTGNLLVEGGQVFSQGIVASANTNVNDPKFWHSTVTDIPQIIGLLPPAVLAEEIDNEHPERIRALFCVNSNPVHSVVDTTATVKALERLDLLVTMDCALTETARMSDYILPNTTGYECWEMPSFGMVYPGIFTQLRQPVLEPEGEILDTTEIWLRLMEKMGYLPQLPPFLYEAAKGPREEYKKALAEYLKEHPEVAPRKLAVIARTLGAVLGAPSKAVVWALLQTKNQNFKRACARAGFAEGEQQMEQLFEALLAHPEGMLAGYMDTDELMDLLETEDKKIHLYAQEMEDWVYELTPEREEEQLNNAEFPLVLVAGRHMEGVINHTMRGPEWIRAKGDLCTVTIHPADAERLGIREGQSARVITNKGSVELPAHIGRETRRGSVIIPHGFGFCYDGVVRGVNINVLTDAAHRDRFAATPFHRYVPCRVEVV